jgi:hypothetical protein
MNQELNDIVDVVVSFKANEVVPKFFKWRQKIYQVNKVHLVHTSREGQQLLYHFSVSDAVNYFQLTFNSFNLSWRLTGLYNQG